MTAKQNPKKELAELLETKRRQTDRPIWEILDDIAQSIPEEALDKVPHDRSVDYRHYL